MRSFSKSIFMAVLVLTVAAVCWIGVAQAQAPPAAPGAQAQPGRGVQILEVPRCEPRCRPAMGRKPDNLARPSGNSPTD